MVMESKVTSKTSCLKALLLRAWRERWSDLQWGINIKTVLPRGVSGDVYNLADCILQQALVGAGANQLVLSYLRHSLSAQVVSHAAVLQRLSKYKEWSKVHCIFSLLEFLEGMLSGITCSGKPEETLLATAVLSITYWLLNVILNCKSSVQILKKSTHLLELILKDDFYLSFICLGRYNDADLFAETSRKCKELLLKLSESDHLVKYIKKLEHIDVKTIKIVTVDDKWPGSLIQCWLEVKLVGNPGASTKSFCDQLQMFQKLKNFDNRRLYAELIRGSLLALYDVNQTSPDSHWGPFVFLKVPYILLGLGKNDSGSIVKGVELVIQHGPLLDVMDSNNSCSNLDFFLGELVKLGLISDIQSKSLLEKRKMSMQMRLKIDTTPTHKGIPKAIYAETVFSGVLKSLSSDYLKVQDPLLGMLNQVLTGKSLEVILAVATVKGQLHTFVERLIRYNESCKTGSDKSKSQIFDFSFLMLVATIQNYGDVALLDQQGESFFEQWAKSCMIEKHKPKAPEQFLRLGDSVKIEALLQQFNAGEADFSPNVKWHEVLFNMPGVMHEVLVAWEQGALIASDVKRILDAVRGRMCCLPMVAAAWLCAYMRTAPQENLLKPVNMVQQLLASPATKEDNILERWDLTCDIIRRIQRDIQLPLQTKSSHHLISRQPAIEQLNTIWSSSMIRGWLDYKSVKSLYCLLDTAGSRWLVSASIQKFLKLRYRDQLKRATDLALAIFHVNIGQCTLELLSHVLPQLLFNDLQATSLMEPQLSALACLTSYCVYTAYEGFTLEENDDCSPTKRAKFLDENSTFTEQLLLSLKQLLIMFENGLQEGYITQQTYFAFYLIKSLVQAKVNSAILAAIPPTLVSDLLKTLPELFSYPLLLHLHDINLTTGRINMAKDLCILRNYHLRCIPSDTDS